MIARQARQLIVFQRTANFSIPAWNEPLKPEVEQAWKNRYHEYRGRARDVGTLYEFSDKAASQASHADRQHEYERRWNKGGVNFVHAFNDTMLEQASNDAIADFVRAKIRAIVKDAEVAESLCPNDHPLGSKRICVDTGYYGVYNRDNVKLVDLKKTPIEEVNRTGVRTKAAHYELDALVCATGYDALTGALLGIDLRGRDGVTIQQKWADGPRTYLGLMTQQFPNLFVITGAGSPSVLVNMVVGIEHHVEWICDCLQYLRDRGLARIEATKEAEDHWVLHVNAAGRPDAVPQGQLVVPWRQRARQAARVHALRLEDRHLPAGVPGNRGRRVSWIRHCQGAGARNAMSPERYLRTFDLIGLLVRRNEGLRLTEIKDALDLPASSLHNMLQTMAAAEVVTVSDDLRYSVGPRVVGIALATVNSLDVRTLARRPLQELAKAIGDDVYLGMSMGRRVFYVDRCAGTQRVSLDIRLGEPVHLHCTATGKLFAAFDPKLASRALAGPLKKLTPNTITDARELEQEYERIRSRGYAKSDEEGIEGVVGYAVPILQAHGTLAAAVHVSVIGHRATKSHERKLIQAARDCAGQVERGLGHVQRPTAAARP